jgi:predicted anti-sigma-YlaC factor YlaD
VDCNEVLERLADYLDEDARAELCRAIEAHLEHCRECQVEVDTVKKTIVLYQADRQITTPVAISERLQSLLSRAYAEDSNTAQSD